MSAALPKLKVGMHLTGKQSAVLLMAGLGSFLLAFLSQGTRATAEQDQVEVIPRHQRLNAAGAALDPASAVASATVVPPAESVQISHFRMNKLVVRDPFGILAPEAAAIPSASVASAPPKSPAKGSKAPVPPALAQAVTPSSPPAAPVAPPLPFTALGFIQGNKIGDGQQQTFIREGETLTVIRQGDTINNTYRVDDINAERIVLTYLPLGQKQSLSLSQ